MAAVSKCTYFNKVLPLEDLADNLATKRAMGQRIVLCHGTFDLMHVGHIKHFKKAKSLGDILVVTLTADAYVNKGPDRPVFNQSLRAEQIAALTDVDFVGIVDESTAIKAIRLLRPTIYVKGGEYEEAAADVTGNIHHERAAVEEYGGSVRFTHEMTFSSSALLNQHFSLLPDAVQEFMQTFKQHYTASAVFSAFQALKPLRVLVIGDAIIDEYNYTVPLGQVSKADVLAVRFKENERFAGGCFAVANHIAGFVEQVDLLTAIGEEHKNSAFIKEHLTPNVRPTFYYYPGKTLTKRRYIGNDFSRLFEIYDGGSNTVNTDWELEICNWLKSHLKKYDMVVVPDFGNGFISPAMINVLVDKAKFLAVNTQANSANRGYHVITRYPHVDYVCLNEPELRLAAHDRDHDITEVTQQVLTSMDAQYLLVTRGFEGVRYLTHRGIFGTVPALATQVVDRIGAGDALLSLSSLMLSQHHNMELAAFAGSVAAALAVQIVCNKEAVLPHKLFKYTETLFK